MLCGRCCSAQARDRHCSGRCQPSNFSMHFPRKFTPEGKVLGGMKLTPCGGYMVYPLGSILVVRSMTGKNKQAFLEGHTSEISCVAISSDGTRIVSGQVRTYALLVLRMCLSVVVDFGTRQACCHARRERNGGTIQEQLCSLLCPRGNYWGA